MKVLIVSDTHGKHENLRTILRREKHIDRMIHLGDAEGYEDMIAQMADCPLDIVQGNNDYFCQLEQEKEIEIGKYKAFLTHGHYYCVNMGLADIMKEGKSRGADIVMFGHTHRPVIQYGDGIIALNPGSVSYPRQEGKQPSYIIMEIDRAGEAEFSIKYV
ncbi:MAG: metallophosphoesterase [Lachnospiraceae bacterium]|nr:metallophosphoesterase [Lachnospiraceae bacterium]